MEKIVVDLFDFFASIYLALGNSFFGFCRAMEAGLEGRKLIIVKMVQSTGHVAEGKGIKK